MTVEKGPSAGRRAWVANPRDFYGALALLLLALCMLWGTRDLPGWYGFQLGAGSVPRLFAALLAANALIVMAVSALRLITCMRLATVMWCSTVRAIITSVLFSMSWADPS